MFDDYGYGRSRNPLLRSFEHYVKPLDWSDDEVRTVQRWYDNHYVQGADPAAIGMSLDNVLEMAGFSRERRSQAAHWHKKVTQEGLGAIKPPPDPSPEEDTARLDAIRTLSRDRPHDYTRDIEREHTDIIARQLARQKAGANRPSHLPTEPRPLGSELPAVDAPVLGDPTLDAPKLDGPELKRSAGPATALREAWANLDDARKKIWTSMLTDEARDAPPSSTTTPALSAARATGAAEPKMPGMRTSQQDDNPLPLRTAETMGQSTHANRAVAGDLRLTQCARLLNVWCQASAFRCRGNCLLKDGEGACVDGTAIW